MSEGTQEPSWNNINRVNHSNFSGNSRLEPRVTTSSTSHEATEGINYQRMDSRRPRISSYSPSSRSSTTRTPHRPQRPKKIVNRSG
ncbi:hypothetical protein Tco_0097041 [Tanacetum coccineum]